MIEISRKIQKVEIFKSKPDTVEMGEHITRPSVLRGSTYKIKTPIFSAAIYVTINDMVLNEGTESEERRPFEIFINSKNMESFQWMVAITRIISAVFRKGGDVVFLIEELHSVFDPKGGYFQNGKYVPSLIAELGDIIEQHLKHIGMLEEKEVKVVEKAETHKPIGETNKPIGASCPQCSQLSLVRQDGCDSCLSCGFSKCG